MNTEAPDSNTKTAWLTMLREGGRWEPRELGQAIDPAGRINVNALLGRMVNYSQVHRFPIAGSLHCSYGITAECRIPSGVTLAELVTAVNMQEPPP